MTDLEITRLCAEAMGYTLTRASTGPWQHDEDGIPTYDPLRNDAQAMALVKKFRITILSSSGGYLAVCAYANGGEHDDLNRAICSCVAAMQKAKCPA